MAATPMRPYQKPAVGILSAQVVSLGVTALLLAVPARAQTVRTGTAPAAPTAEATRAAEPGPAWSLVKLNGREYATSGDLADFYGLSRETRTGRKLRLEEGATTLMLESGSRKVEVNGVAQWLSFPVVQSGDNWLISRLDLVKTIEPALRPEHIANLEPIEVVVLDPGHGGHDRGAVSPYGTEKEFALDVATKVRDILRQRGVVVLMTRDSDEFLSLEERARIANGTRNSLLVSIHFNDADFGSEANGFEVFALAPRGGPGTMDTQVGPAHLRSFPGNAVDNCSLGLATSIHHSILAHMGRLDRGVKRQRFAVLKLTKVPAVLVECGFLNAREESRVVATEKWRQRLAYALVEGIMDYREMAATRRPPKALADYLGTATPTTSRREEARKSSSGPTAAVAKEAEPRVVVP